MTAYLVAISGIFCVLIEYTLTPLVGLTVRLAPGNRNVKSIAA